MQDNKRLSMVAMAAMTVAAAGAVGFMGGSTASAPRRQRKPTPRMVTSDAATIAAWNSAVHERNAPKRARQAKNASDRAMDRSLRSLNTGQHPKFPKARVHKQAKHPLRDEHGAYTLIGRPHPWLTTQVLFNGGRRIWLAGISAQRGY